MRLIEAFLLCQEMNIYPPLWILDGLAERFKKYFKSATRGGDAKLNDYMGLKKPLFRERIFNSIKWPLMQDICYLNHYWGISIGNACGFVAAKLRESKTENNSEFQLKGRKKTKDEESEDINGDTIEKWYKQLKANYYLNNIQVHGPHVISEIEAESFLQQFPADTRKLILSTAKRNPTIPL